MNPFTPSTSRTAASRRLLLPAAQLVATLLILAFPIGNVLKLGAFAVVWGVTFRRLSSREWLCFLGVCTLFSIMDILSVRQGVFRFSRADVAGLPIWEFSMWGFLVLHILRALNGPVPVRNLRLVLPLAALFALPFATLSDHPTLLISSGIVLTIALFFYHEQWDIRYVAYAVLLGAAFEYVGVWSGQWEYPSHPTGGVAFWFVSMWGGIGLFVRRLVVPLVRG